MKKKATLVLMELSVMLLVFALAAALCLKAFSKAEETSRRAGTLDKGVTAALSAAETVKACRGDLAAAAVLLEGRWDGERLTVTEEVTVTVTPAESGHPLMGLALVQVTDAKGQAVYSLEAAWQKEAAHE